MQQTILNDNEELLNKLFHKHATSAALSMIGVQGCLMINAILAGKFFGGEGLAVMSVVSPIYSIYAAIGALTGIGGSIITAHALGRDDKEAANKSFSCALIVCVILSGIVSGFSLLFQDEFLNVLGSVEKIFFMCKSYSTVYIVGGVCTALFYMPYHFLKLTGHLKYLTAIFLGMAIINGILDWIFCIEMQMGMAGIALGTVVASLITVLLGLKTLLHSFKFTIPHSSFLIKELFRFGAPSALRQCLLFARFVLMNNLLVMAAGQMGLLIFSVVKVIENLSTIILSGISQATSAFVAVFFQEKDNTSIRRIEKRAHLISFELILTLIIGVWLFSSGICDLFGIKNLSEQVSIIEAIRIFSISLIPSIFCMNLTSYYQSTKFTKLANLITANSNFILLVIPAYFLAPHFGINMIWYSFTIAAVGTLIILAVILFINRKEDQSPIFLLDLNSEKNGSYISFAVKTNVEDIANAVNKISAFCEKNKLNNKETMLVKLSMEEMMMSIKDHCFNDNADKTMDVRILIIQKDDNNATIVLRIRNSGKLFNPIDYYKHMKKNNDMDFVLSDALGIAMIIKAADAIHYKTTFGINNLTILIDSKEATA
ncbi:MAG: hypothetical protein IJ797_00285 [Selenomonadaceae bacterium]|nr:hypothetical protein [Selenomonadaceae bacterium]